MSSVYLIPEDESLEIVGPFRSKAEAVEFAERHLRPLGATLRSMSTPDEWVLGFAEDQSALS